MQKKEKKKKLKKKKVVQTRLHMFVGVRASLPLMEACWSEIDRQRGDRREEPLHPPQLPKLLSPGSEKKQRRDFFPLSLFLKKKKSILFYA